MGSVHGLKVTCLSTSMKVTKLPHGTASTPTPILWGCGHRRVLKGLLGWNKVHPPAPPAPPQPAALSMAKLCPGQGPVLTQSRHISFLALSPLHGKMLALLCSLRFSFVTARPPQTCTSDTIGMQMTYHCSVQERTWSARVPTS